MKEGGAGRQEEKTANFFLPSTSPSLILNPSASPLKLVFDLSQLSGSINVQDGGTTSFPKTNHGSRSKIRPLCKLEGCVKMTLIVSCLEWLTSLFLFIMVEFEKVLYSLDLKMVLIFLVTKIFLKGTMFK